MTELQEARHVGDTNAHIREVNRCINTVVCDLLERASKHDESKLEDPEAALFAEVNADLHGITYNSPEYKANLEKLEPALKHHYAHNRHHPQHWKNGIDDMNLCDLVEMFCDWRASSMRHSDGNLRKSIDINAKRFEMSQQLVRIFENTVDLVDK